jgi:quercetin dioxygenase-like cupin family protein
MRLLLALMLLSVPALAGPPVAGPEAPVARAADQRARVNPPGTAQVVELVRGAGAFLGLLTLEPGAQVPVHRDATEEYVVLVEGGGVLTIDGKQHTLGEGDAVYMAPNAEVSFTNGDRRSTVIQVFAGPAPADKYAGWAVAPTE